MIYTFLDSFITTYKISIKIKSNSNTKIIKYISNCHDLIKIFIIFQCIIFNFFSLLFFFNFYNNIAIKKRLSLQKFLKRKIFVMLQTNKLFELVYSISVLEKKSDKSPLKKIQINNNITKTDNLVIGSGPGGSITAFELQKNKKDVLIIESGQYFDIPKTKHPFVEFLNKWRFSALSSSIGQIIQYSSGNCFGGGSEINSGLYHSPDYKFVKKIYKNISKKEFNAVLKYLKKNINISKSIKLNKYQKNLKNIYLRGASKLDWKIENIPKLYKQSVKSSMTNTILKRYLIKKGNVLLNCKALKIFKKNDFYEVKIIHNGKNKLIECKNIFIACGPPYSQNLLKNSKIKKNINNNFHFHPMIKVIGEFNKKVNSQMSQDVISNQITEFFPKFIIGNAASGEPFLRISLFDKINKSFSFKNCSIFHATLSLGKGKIIKLPLIKDEIIKYTFSKKEKIIIKLALEKLIQFVRSCGARNIYIADNQNKLQSINKSFDIKNYNIKNLKYSSVHLLGGIDTSNYGKIKNEKIFVNDSSLINEPLLKNPQGTTMFIAKHNIDKIIKKNIL
jgi:hypothetical protein